MKSVRILFLATLAAWCVAAAAFAEREIAIGALPKEAREVLVLIKAGGPFPYERDGVTFGNREGNLPHKARGYYREYTVPTPGVKTRGARRIVCGGPQRVPTACWYTADHYRTFARIRE
jgi:ribonuclease T1